MCEPKSASHCATIEGEGLPSVAGHCYSSLPTPSPPQPHMSLVLPHRTPFYGVHIVRSVFGVGAGIAVNEILCASTKALSPKNLELSRISDQLYSNQITLISHIGGCVQTT